MAQRIPLDSTAWDPQTSDHENPVPLLKKLVAGNPDVVDVEYLLDDFWTTDGDGPETQFFYAIPYLLDVFEKAPDKYAGPIFTFCMLVRGMDWAEASDQRRIQLDASRERILNLICEILVRKGAESDYSHVAILLSGIANLFCHTDLGQQLTNLTPDTDLSC